MPLGPGMPKMPIVLELINTALDYYESTKVLYLQGIGSQLTHLWILSKCKIPYFSYLSTISYLIIILSAASRELHQIIQMVCASRTALAVSEIESLIPNKISSQYSREGKDLVNWKGPSRKRLSKSCNTHIGEIFQS